MPNLLCFLNVFILWSFMMPYSASAASADEIQALRDVAAGLGATEWNLTTDPCSGRWPGIQCCRRDDLNSTCCNTPFKPDTALPCDTTAENSTIVGVNLDSFYRSGRMLTGHLPDSICNLTSLVTLDLNNNFLTGRIPPCIGDKLTRLRKLGLSGGNITGGFPAELGQLSRLEEIYLDNNNLEGRIPASIGGMSSLTLFYARNNRLVGEIPAEIGSMTNLIEINLQVNNLNGTLPPLANLTRLTKLLVFDNQLSGDCSFILTVPGLTRVDLHRNRLTGGIPALDERFANLTYVNLGFNELTGSIPESVTRLPSLESLFLGHNQLNGTLPSLSSTSFRALQNLDISHNSLTGTLPSFPESMNVDFSFNSFDTGGGGANLLKDGESYFNCLPSTERNLSCPRSQAGREYSFTVHGGVSSSVFMNKDRTVFGRDATRNKTGLHYLETNRNWALEVSGEFDGVLNLGPSLAQIIKAPPEDDPALYQTMRWSSSYMAYHGSNLQNGNYSVTLYFCELSFQSASFRAFDVLVQGKLIASRLDVVKEVKIHTGYKLTTNASVTDGRMSIEFIYTGPDRYLAPGSYNVPSSGAMVSAISVRSFNPPNISSSSTWKIAVVSSVVILSFVAVLAVLIVCRLKKRKGFTNIAGVDDEGRRRLGGAVGIKRYSYKELHEATNGFNPENKLGQGGFGSVYLGRLPNNHLVAVKQLLHQTEQGREAFKKETEILSSVQHRNLVAVRGYCLDAEHPMLVCDYMQNGSLDQFLHGNRGFLSWKQRQKIAVDTAFGMAYLHDESKHRIIHCDMKPPNILLDEDFTPRIADFGMARLYEEGRSHVTATRMGGTIGYLAPEYAMHYQLSDKADVYSFGVVLLELISGRRAVDSSFPTEQTVLVEFAHVLASVSVEELGKLVDSRLEKECDMKEVVNMARVAVLCTLESPALRPKMRSVWLMLKGTLAIPDIPSTLDNRFSTVRALLSAYEHMQSSAVNSSEKLIAISPR